MECWSIGKNKVTPAFHHSMFPLLQQPKGLPYV